MAALMDHAAGRSVLAARVPRDGALSIDETSIAALVQRCDNLDGAKARLCQRRICEGYWGKAQACPARSAARQE